MYFYSVHTNALATECLLGLSPENRRLNILFFFHENKRQVVFVLSCGIATRFKHVVNSDSLLANAAVYYRDVTSEPRSSLYFLNYLYV